MVPTPLKKLAPKNAVMREAVTVAGAIVWGLYPYRPTAWIAHAWLTGVAMVTMVPVTWAVIFAAIWIYFRGRGGYKAVHISETAGRVAGARA